MSMLTSAIGAHAGHVAEGRRSVTANVVRPDSGEGSGYSIEVDGHGACSSFTGAKFTRSRWGAA